MSLVFVNFLGVMGKINHDVGRTQETWLMKKIDLAHDEDVNSKCCLEQKPHIGL